MHISSIHSIIIIPFIIVAHYTAAAATAAAAVINTLLLLFITLGSFFALSVDDILSISTLPVITVESCAVMRVGESEKEILIRNVSFMNF